MNNTISTPVVENVTMKEKYIDISVEMSLAGVKVTVEGSYNVGLNAFNPSTIKSEDEFASLETFCDRMGWDEYETRLVIQEAFESR